MNKIKVWEKCLRCEMGHNGMREEIVEYCQFGDAFLLSESPFSLLMYIREIFP